MSNVIEVADLRKSYGRHEVVHGIDLHVEQGEVVAFLGPNGSGKTTTIEILEGFGQRDAGEVTVLGHDPATAPRSWRERIGIVLQESQPVPELTVAETLAMQAGYYGDALAVDHVLDLVGLVDSADQRTRRLSGGQQRRLDLAMALIGDPELVFLDEPTTGFDPTARRDAWAMINRLKDAGRTVLLTTHYMDEAEALADRIVMIADGRIVARGTADELSKQLSVTPKVVWRQGADASRPPGDLMADHGSDGAWSIETIDVVGALNRLTAWALADDVELVGLTVERPDLEDVFLHLADERGAET